MRSFRRRKARDFSFFVLPNFALGIGVLKTCGSELFSCRPTGSHEGSPVFSHFQKKEKYRSLVIRAGSARRAAQPNKKMKNFLFFAARA